MQLFSSGLAAITQHPGILKLAALIAVSLALCACSTSRPCDTASANLQGASDPPHSCRVDGCSMVPDFDFGHCCDQHDQRYWQGGSAKERIGADKRFGQCIVDAGHPIKAKIYYYGVRLGGTPHLPTPWRWGFGWDYPSGYFAPRETPESPLDMSEKR